MGKEPTKYEFAMWCMETQRRLQESLRVPVMIDSDQVLHIVIRDLISKRSCMTINTENKAHFDWVLMAYLGSEDFQKYVIEWKKLPKQ